MMDMCWDMDPDKRATFTQLKKTIVSLQSASLEQESPFMDLDFIVQEQLRGELSCETRTYATLPSTGAGVCLFLYSNLTLHITLYYTHTISLSFTLICCLALSFHPEDCSIVLSLAPESVHLPSAAAEESTSIATVNSPAIEQCECEYS